MTLSLLTTITLLNLNFKHVFLFTAVIQSLSHTRLLVTHKLQHPSLPCPSQSPGVCSNSYSLSRWCHPTISSSALRSPSSLNLSQHQGLFQWVSCLHQCSQSIAASASVLPSILWFCGCSHHFLYNFLSFQFTPSKSQYTTIVWSQRDFFIYLSPLNLHFSYQTYNSLLVIIKSLT